MISTPVPLGDSHNGAERVCLVTENGVRMIHKPRPAAMERAFEAFLSILGQEGFPHLPRTQQILAEGSEWHRVRYEQPVPLNTPEEIERYFRTCGTLVFLTYLLGSTDLHEENILSCGTSPIVIDVETLLSGVPRTPETGTAVRDLTHSVLATHLLPNWILRNDAPVDCSGLSGIGANEANLPHYRGEPLPLWRYAHVLFSGFQEAYRFALSHRSAVDNALSVFAGCRARLLLRPTVLYERLIDILVATPVQQRSEKATLLLERAYRRDIRPDRLNEMRRACDEEIASVLRGDIPYFYTLGESHDLFSRSGCVCPGFLSASPLEHARSNLSILCEQDLTAQTKILRQAVDSIRPCTVPSQAPSREDIPLPQLLLSTLEEGHIPALTTGWMELGTTPRNDAYLKSVDPGLYSGLLGILCAYAAIYARTGEQHVLGLLRAHYAPFHDHIAALSGSCAVPFSDLSLSTGAAGWLQALLHIHAMTGDPIFTEDAGHVLSRIDLSELPANNDPLSGSSGLALALRNAADHPALRSRSCSLAAQLLPHCLPASAELTGAAHGAAGMASALASLGSVLYTVECDRAILRLLRFERQHLFRDRGNWRDLRVTDEIRFMNGWCSGAPGIGMTRLHILKHTQDPEIAAICNEDLAVVRTSLQSDLTTARDCLCCGNSARLMAISALGISNDRLYTVLADRVRKQEPVFSRPLGTCDPDYGLMQGYAGVAYALMLYRDPRCGGMLM